MLHVEQSTPTQDTEIIEISTTPVGSPNISLKDRSEKNLILPSVVLMANVQTK